MKRIFLFLACTVLAGCSSVGPGFAHHPVDCAMGFAWADCLPGTSGYNNGGGQQIRTEETQKSFAELKTCFAYVYHNPEYAPITSHLPSPETGYQPTMSQLSDDSRPSKRESQLLIKHHDDMLQCRQTFLQNPGAGTPPGIVQIMREGWVDGDAITIQLVKRKITWGESAQKNQQLALNVQKKMQQVSNAIAQANATAALYQAEMAQRQQEATANTLSQWNAQMQNHMPTRTNCSMMGNTMDCNTYH